MSKLDKKPIARKMRSSGKTILEIASKLGISKGTASIWCRDITLSEDQINKIMEKHKDSLYRGRMMGVIANKQRKKDSIARAKERAQEMIRDRFADPIFFSSIALYWAEGSKSEYSTGFQFINSDPEMILLMKDFLLSIGVSFDDIFCAIQINESHKNRISEVLNFWQNLLKFSGDQIRNPVFIKTVSKKVYDNHHNYYGVCRLQVKKSTELKYLILALIDRFKTHVGVAQLVRAGVS